MSAISTWDAVHSEDEHRDASKPGPLGQGAPKEHAPTPWVSASETLPDCTDDQPAADDIEEASMESFPCSDPPSHGAGHA